MCWFLAYQKAQQKRTGRKSKKTFKPCSLQPNQGVQEEKRWAARCALQAPPYTRVSDSTVWLICRQIFSPFFHLPSLPLCAVGQDGQARIKCPLHVHGAISRGVGSAGLTWGITAIGWRAGRMALRQSVSQSQPVTSNDVTLLADQRSERSERKKERERERSTAAKPSPAYPTTTMGQ